MNVVKSTGVLLLIIMTYMLALISSSKMIYSLIIFLLSILHTITIDKLRSKVLNNELNIIDWFLILLNMIPYIFLFNVFLFIPGAFYIASVIMAYLKVREWSNVLALTGSASLYLPWVEIMGVIKFTNIVIFAIWVSYSFTESLYIEYKLPYKTISANYVRNVWFPLLLVLIFLSAFQPILILSLIEPTIRFFKPGEKLKSGSEIKKLGRKTGIQYSLVLIILIFSQLIRF
ncbi:MAG: hypothetical protein QW128_00055 [Thermoprotei archaeon]